MEILPDLLPQSAAEHGLLLLRELHGQQNAGCILAVYLDRTGIADIESALTDTAVFAELRTVCGSGQCGEHSRRQNAADRRGKQFHFCHGACSFQV